jgi:hypothetical protein
LARRIKRDAPEIAARLTENLHRAELTELEWSEHVAEWKRLAEQKEVEGISGQNVQKIAKDGTARGRPEGGTAKAARDLPIPGPTEDARRKQVERAVKIAGIAPEAKGSGCGCGSRRQSDRAVDRRPGRTGTANAGGKGNR